MDSSDGRDLPDVATRAEAVVRDFFAAVESGDSEAATALVTDDMWWDNVSLPIVRGRKAVKGALDLMYRQLDIEIQAHHLAVEQPDTGGQAVGAPVAVLTERTDVLYRGRFRMSFWVCGTLYVSGDKISGWRDRFDLVGVTRAAIGGLVGIIWRPRR